MSTQKALAEALGVTTQTILNNKNLGYALSHNADGTVNIEGSVQAYVRFQAQRITDLSRQKTALSSENDENEEKQSLEYWRTEKEKAGALKLQRQNEEALGNLIPSVALIELINAPLSYVRNRLVSLPSLVQKRNDTFDPMQLKVIEDIVLAALEALDPKDPEDDDLRKEFGRIITQYSPLHRTEYFGHSSEKEREDLTTA